MKYNNFVTFRRTFFLSMMFDFIEVKSKSLRRGMERRGWDCIRRSFESISKSELMLAGQRRCDALYLLIQTYFVSYRTLAYDVQVYIVHTIHSTFINVNVIRNYCSQCLGFPLVEFRGFFLLKQPLIPTAWRYNYSRSTVSLAHSKVRIFYGLKTIIRGIISDVRYVNCRATKSCNK